MKGLVAVVILMLEFGSLAMAQFSSVKSRPARNAVARQASRDTVHWSTISPVTGTTRGLRACAALAKLPCASPSRWARQLYWGWSTFAACPNG